MVDRLNQGSPQLCTRYKRGYDAATYHEKLEQTSHIAHILDYAFVTYLVQSPCIMRLELYSEVVTIFLIISHSKQHRLLMIALMDQLEERLVDGLSNPGVIPHEVKWVRIVDQTATEKEAECFRLRTVQCQILGRVIITAVLNADCRRLRVVLDKARQVFESEDSRVDDCPTSAHSPDLRVTCFNS